MGFVIGLILGVVATAAVAVWFAKYGLPLAIARGWIR